MRREPRVAEVFVELADTLIAEFDLVDFLKRLAEVTVELLDVDAAGLMLADHDDQLQAMAASDENTALLELFELQHDEGPCLDCFRSGQPVVNVELGAARWPLFAAAARDAGFVASHALPLRLRHDVIGALNLFSASPAELGPDDVALGQALADVATIGLLQERAVRRRELLAEQLQHALNSRVLIEQAKGVFAERAMVDMRESFEALRRYARSNGRPLNDVAASVIDGSLDTKMILGR
jgi:transcriptional regulator with GAF, ATPase, and Fis domain